MFSLLLTRAAGFTFFSLLPSHQGDDIAKATAKDWRGIRVTVCLTVQNRQVCAGDTAGGYRLSCGLS